MTGDLNQTLKCLCIFLFIFLLSSSLTTVSSSSASSSTQQIQPQNDPSSSVPIIPSHYQVFDLKNNDPIFQERFKKRLKKKKKNKKAKKHRKKMKPSRPFSVMLPKGFVPPSRSSPCHNDYPTSMTFHCHLNNNN